MFDLKEINAVTGIISHFAIVVAMISLAMQLRQNKFLNKLAYKDRFVASTARLNKILELLLSNESLNHINIGIYKRRLPAVPEDEAIIRGKELALCAMIFQLMEDVWTTHDLETDKDSAAYAGWKETFKDWMETPEIAAYWPILKHQYGTRFVADTEGKYFHKANAKAKA